MWSAGRWANHLRTERVLDAFNMALWQRRPESVIHHSDQGTQYTSTALGTRSEDETAIFDYIEGFYNSHRRHSAIDYESPMNYERRHERRFAAA